MALETGTYISDLNSSNPVATDGLAQADDHLRLVKSTIKATLPGLTGAVTSTHTELNTLDGYTGNTADLNILSGAAAAGVTGTELGYLDGVTSALQTQINSKQATVTGAATTIVSSNLTADRALLSDSSGKAAVSSVTSTELGYLSNVTSSIQTQLNNKASTSGQATSTWQTGTGTTESVVSPAKLKAAVKSSLNSSGTAPIYGVRAWVNFAGNGSNGANATLNGSGNVASVYKTAHGNYTVTFTTAMPDANYAITFGAGNSTSVSDGNGLCMDVYSQSASAFSMAITDPTDNNMASPRIVMLTVVR